MSWTELLWLPPVMLAVAMVLGAAGRTGARAIARSIASTFAWLTGGVILVGLVIHVVARVFA
jgi:hypothetical protein